MKVKLSRAGQLVLIDAWRRGAPALAYRAPDEELTHYLADGPRTVARPWGARLVANEDCARLELDNLDAMHGRGHRGHYYDGTRWLW